MFQRKDNMALAALEILAILVVLVVLVAPLFQVYLEVLVAQVLLEDL